MSTADAIRRRRPAGITVSCWVLALNAVAGFRGGTLVRERFLSVDPQSLRAPAGTVVALLEGIAVAYGTTALAAAIGLWQLRKWGPGAYAAWATVACTYAAAAAALVRIPTDGGALLEVSCVDVLFVVIAFAWGYYIRRSYRRVGAL